MTSVIEPVVIDQETELKYALQAASNALAVYTQKEKLPNGLELCCRGRVYRAQHLMANVPREQWEAANKKIDALAEIVDKRRAMLVAAEQHYRDLCRKYNVEPELDDLPVCDCEGCRMFEQAVEHIAQAASGLGASVV